MSSNDLTYKQRMGGAQLLKYLKAIGLSVVLFVFSMITINNFGKFGSSILAPLIGAMWVGGVICAWLIPSQKTSILNETHITIGVYLITLFAIRLLIKMLSGVSSEMMQSAFNQPLALTSGSTITGYLQTLMWITTVMTPLGFLGMQGKKVLTFRKKANQKKELERLRGFRQNDRQHMEDV